MARYYHGYVTEGNFYAETPKALAFEVDCGRFNGGTYPIWLPKSQIKWGKKAEGTNNVKIYIPCWLLDNKRVNPDRVLGIRFDRELITEF